jgi:cytidyltransferase-like protein
MIVYLDGIFDLFHFGHIESFRKCKELYSDVTLIVGIIGDKVASSYKRVPIHSEEHRYGLVENSKYVDKIIKDSPLIITKEFMEKYKIDLVVHGFSNNNDQNKQDIFFEYPKSINKFKEIEYYKGISTTSILDKISKIYKINK